ncbi:MAG: transcriptional repressor [Anaerolineales bacterium]
MKDSTNTSESSTSTTAEKIHAALEVQTRRRTRPRKRIAEKIAKLATSGADFTVEDLWHDLKRHDSHLGRTTVFRAVEMLVNKGLLNRIEFADGSHTYRACGDEHHHHLTCVQCHRVVDVDVCLPKPLLAAIGKKTGFEIEGHSLFIFGRCADCRNR